jgi:hypothetical protein
MDVIILLVVSRRLPTTAQEIDPRTGNVGSVVGKTALGRIPLRISISLPNSYSTNCSILNHLGLYQPTHAINNNPVVKQGVLLQSSPGRSYETKMTTYYD